MARFWSLWDGSGGGGGLEGDLGDLGDVCIILSLFPSSSSKEQSLYILLLSILCSKNIL